MDKRNHREPHLPADKCPKCGWPTRIAYQYLGGTGDILIESCTNLECNWGQSVSTQIAHVS